MKILRQLFATSTALTSAVAFTVPTPHTSKVGRATPSSASMPNVTPMSRYFGVWRQMTSDGVDEATTQFPKKRRKRKDGKQFSPPSSTQPESENDSTEIVVATEPEPVEEEAPAAPPKQDLAALQVPDIRDVVSGAPESLTDDEEDDKELEDDEELADDEEWEYYDIDDSGNEIITSDDGMDGRPDAGMDGRPAVGMDDEELADDEEWEYYDIDDSGNEIITSDDKMDGRPDVGMDGRPDVGMDERPQDDSMEQLLADARRIRSSTTTEDNEEESSMSIFNVISTIVTVDFFVVIGLFLWFLAGIFCSTVLGSDTVQIAFNMNFERVTQPALGILMIGAVAGSIGNKDEEEEY